MQAQVQQLFQIAFAMQREGRNDDAIAHYQAVLNCEPSHPGAHSNLGMLLANRDQLEAGFVHCQIAAELRPDDGGIANNYGNLLWRLHRFDEARSQLHKARELRPDDFGVWHNSGLLFYSTGQLQESIKCYAKAIKLNPDHPDVLSDFAYPILASGDLQNGLSAHEARWLKLLKHPAFDAGIPQWTGEEDLTDKTVLVTWEQGFGDTLQFCRFVEDLRQRCGKVIFSVQKPLQRLMVHAVPGAQIIGPFMKQIKGTHYEVDTESETLPKADYFIPLMSLPWRLGFSYADVRPYRLPVFPGAPVLRHDGRLKVGLVWAGNPGFEADRRRSMSLQDLMPLADPSLQLYSLQVGARAADIGNLGCHGFITDLSPLMTDFAASTGLIAQMDAVVAVDTSTLHLAAGVGVPCYALLPHLRCWRWLRNRTDSPWYDTLQIVQQAKPGDWAGVVSRLKKLLQIQIRRRQAA